MTSFWNMHYHPGCYGSFHADMAHAFKAMLADRDFVVGYPGDAQKVRQSIRLHKEIERDSRYTGRKWFTEIFGA